MSCFAAGEVVIHARLAASQEQPQRMVHRKTVDGTTTISALVNDILTEWALSPDHYKASAAPSRAVRVTRLFLFPQVRLLHAGHEYTDLRGTLSRRLLKLQHNLQAMISKIDHEARAPERAAQAGQPHESAPVVGALRCGASPPVAQGRLRSRSCGRASC
jgi:hypothetical protein